MRVGCRVRRVSGVRVRVLLGVVTLLVGVLGASGCGAAPETPCGRRKRLFEASSSPVLEQVLCGHSEWVLLYWPAVNSCDASAQAVVAALRGFVPKDPLEVVTVLPEGAPEGKARIGSSEAGRVVRVAGPVFQGVLKETPLPRVELWWRGRKLLLLKTLASSPSEAERLVEEVRWLQSVRLR